MNKTFRFLLTLPTAASLHLVSTVKCEGSADKKSSLNKLTAPRSWAANEKEVTWNPNWDLRGDTKPQGCRQIVLIRHGQYDQSKACDDEFRGLTELGQRQAKATGERIKVLLDGQILFPVRDVYYSTMRRAFETYQLILPYLPPLKDHMKQPCSMIREGAVCKPVPAPSANWGATEESFTIDGARVEAAFLNHIHRADEDVKGDYSSIYVCHGNVIRYMVMRALQLPPEAWLRTAVYNSSITIITIYPNGKVGLTCMGEVGHFPPEMITYN